MNQMQFTYASARVRAMEPMLLDSTDIERMLGAQNARDAYKILNDTAYSNHVGDIEDVHAFQEVITAGLKDSKEILERICPDEKILDILFLKYDFHNLKQIVKGKRHGMDREEIKANLLPLGRFGTEEMLRFFLDKDTPFIAIPEKYLEAIKHAIATAEKLSEAIDNDPRVIDLVMDKHMMELILSIALSSRNGFVREFAQKWVDLSNIKAFLRIKLLGQEDYFRAKDLLSQILVEGGKLPLYKYADHLDTDNGNLVNIFRGTDYSESVQAGIEAYEKDKSIANVEIHADNFLLSHIKRSRYIPSGPEVLITYFYAKQNNAQIVRMIMIGKLADLSEEDIRAKLHNLYS